MITERQVLQAAKGWAVIKRFGKRLEMKLNKAEWQQLEQAEAAGYLKAKRSQRALSTVWSYLCDTRKTPDVKITPRVRYARLSADLLPGGRCLTKRGAELVNTLAKRYGRTNERINESPGGTWVFFDVRIEDADRAMAELMTVLRDTSAIESEATQEQPAVKLPDFDPPKFSSYRVTLPQLEQMFGAVVGLANRASALKLENGVTACAWLAYEAEPRLKAIQHSGDVGDAPTLYRALKEHGHRLEADIRDRWAA